MMVRPANFGFNEETAANNTFQTNDSRLSEPVIQTRAIEEFDLLVSKLRSKGVNVIVIQDTADPVKPDAVFSNNWISFHPNGSIFTFPLFSPKRRLERRESIIQRIEKQFDYQAIFSLESFEDYGQFLEGTGSLILDRVNDIAYACMSPRTHLEVLEKFCKITGYEQVAFYSHDRQGVEVYHTNVMMALGETFVVICMDSVTDQRHKEKLYRRFEETDKEVVEISFEQMESFAGNMIQVKNDEHETFLVMSEQAYKSLDREQVQRLEKHTQLLYSPIPTIELYGGGSVRCMMTEIVPPR